MILYIISFYLGTFYAIVESNLIRDISGYLNNNRQGLARWLMFSVFIIIFFICSFHSKIKSLLFNKCYIYILKRKIFVLFLCMMFFLIAFLRLKISMICIDRKYMKLKDNNIFRVKVLTREVR